DMHRLGLFVSSRRRHTRFSRDWSSDVCSSDLHLFPDEIVVPAGFALYRMRFPGRKLIGRLILATYIFPGILLLVPVYQMMASLRSEERRVGKDWRSGASAAA